MLDDLDATLSRLKEEGIEPEREPYRVREGGSLIAFVRDPERYRAEVERRQDDVRAAQHDLGEALTANLVLGQAGSRTPAQLLADWQTMTMNEKRAVVRAYIDRVTLTKADPTRRRWQPITERAQIHWVTAPAPSAA